MTSFDIPNMTCGHCVRSITEAVQAVDPAAQVQADLANHRVHVRVVWSELPSRAEAGHQLGRPHYLGVLRRVHVPVPRVL